MTRPALTIGMPTHTDAHGVYFTVQALRLMHPGVMPQTEILVVDQAPGTPHGESVKNFVGWIKGVHSARYVPAPDPPGSAPAKERVFAEAHGEVVVCIDSHVLLWENSLARLLDWFAIHSDSKDLLAGPMVYDNLTGCSTHLDNVWRGEQWGIWAEARRCKCGHVWQIAIEEGVLSLRDPRHPREVLPGSCYCGARIAPVSGQSLDSALRAAGFTSMIEDNGDPFEVWAHGTGLLACRKDAWPGFAPGYRGFGAEEVLIHERLRKHGGKVLCAPWLKWVHRFMRPDGPQYSLTRQDRVRNYVLGFRDLGMDLAPIHEHFVASGLLPQEQWDVISAGKEIHSPTSASATLKQPTPPRPGCVTCGRSGSTPQRQSQPWMKTLETWYSHVSSVNDDLNKHCETLHDLASQCEHVTEFGTTHSVTTVALLAGTKKLVSYAPVPYSEEPVLSAFGGERFESRRGSVSTAEIEETDLLFLDTSPHNEEHTYAQLVRHAPKAQRILIYGSVVFGETGEGGKSGVLPALRWYMTDHPEWGVVNHWRNNNGLILLSRLPEDRKPLPSTMTMAWNWAKAVAAHALSGGTATEQQFRHRLEICTLCESRTGERCAECGCPCTDKASWSEQVCPIGRWAGDGV